MNGRPTIADVARAYRLVLGRDVENGTVAAQHVVAVTTVWDLIETLWVSPEAVNRRLADALSLVPACHDLSVGSEAASAAQLERLYADVGAVWARRGLGSYHRWLHRNVPRFSERSVKWNVERVFEAGACEADALSRLYARHGHAFLSHQTVVVLGPEAYRLADGIAPQVARYVGIEVAATDMDQGRLGLGARGLLNTEQMLFGAGRDLPRSYDHFYSVQTLQYAPPPMAYDLLDRCLDGLNPGGLAVFQLATGLHQYRFDIDAYLDGTDRDSQGEIHALPQPSVFTVLARHGITPLEVIPDDGAGPLGISYRFVGRKTPAI